MYQAKSIKQSYQQLEALGRKDGVLFLKREFTARNDILISTIELINRPTIVISQGRSNDSLQRISNNWVKTVIKIESNKITGLERWDEKTGTFFYVTGSIENAVTLAIHLAERGDAIFFAPLQYVKDELEMHLQFDREIESLLI